MPDASYWRQQAKRCRELSKRMIEPEVIEHYGCGLWTSPRKGRRAEWRAAERDERIMTV